MVVFKLQAFRLLFVTNIHGLVTSAVETTAPGRADQIRNDTRYK